MSNQKNTSPIPSSFTEVDLQNIKNPAYVVKEITEEKTSETEASETEASETEASETEASETAGGCLFAWNKEFEDFTNFTALDIDEKRCYQILAALKKDTLKEICVQNCPYRTEPKDRTEPKRVQQPTVLKNLWIQCKDIKGQSGQIIRRLVDMCIFPYKTGENTFALHIIIDKGQAHTEKHLREMKEKAKKMQAQKE